jgi:hypothetical protein
MTWTPHINEVAKKVGKTLAILTRMKRQLPSNVLKMLYNSLIVPYLEYGLLAWGDGSTKRLTILQKKAVRCITNSKYLSHTDPLFRSLNILKLCDIFMLRKLFLLEKMKHQKSTPYLQKQWTDHDQFNSSLRNTRGSLVFKLPLIRTKLEEQGILYKCISAFQNAPNYIQENIGSLKQTILLSYSSTCSTPGCYACSSQTAW